MSRLHLPWYKVSDKTGVLEEGKVRNALLPWAARSGAASLPFHHGSWQLRCSDKLRETGQLFPNCYSSKLKLTSVNSAHVQNTQFTSLSLSLSLTLSLPCFCGFFRDPYCRSGALDVEPEIGILALMIFKGELSKETSKQLRVSWDRRSLVKSLFQLKFIISLVPGAQL